MSQRLRYAEEIIGKMYHIVLLTIWKYIKEQKYSYTKSQMKSERLCIWLKIIERFVGDPKSVLALKLTDQFV